MIWIKYVAGKIYKSTDSYHHTEEHLKIETNLKKHESKLVNHGSHSVS